MADLVRKKAAACHSERSSRADRGWLSFEIGLPRALEPRPRENFGRTTHLRIIAPLNLKNANARPTPRHGAAASTKKSLILAWRPGTQVCATSIATANVGSASVNSESMWIAEAKCHPGREKDQKMLKIVWRAGCWPDGRGAEGSDDAAGEQQGPSLKNLLHKCGLYSK
jgi:hypothetical protein